MKTETTAPTARIGVGEHEVAAALGLSVHTLRKDRTAGRRIPFYKIGGSVRYNLDRVREALGALEVGGVPQRKGRR